ncbi:MAG: PAS domain S-box protein [Thermoplasmata archaeon]|nr:PAS domain S-box protein [Thermoplasmata archaeon]
MIIYLIPSIISSIFIPSVILYILSLRSERDYIYQLILVLFPIFLWNAGILLTNFFPNEIIWAEMGTAGLILVPPTILHFSVSYTKFHNSKLYNIIAYIPFLILLLTLVNGNYVEGVVYKGIGYEPVFNDALFYIHSWIGFIYLFLSVYILARHYRKNIGIKKRQALYILISFPLDAFSSYITYIVFEEVFHVAQFPFGSMIDLFTIFILLYALFILKLPAKTLAEIDFSILAETANDGICIVDADGIIEYANSFMAEMLGVHKNKLTGKKLRKFIADEDIESYDEHFNRILSGLKFKNLILKLRGGERNIIVAMNASPIIDRREGDVKGAFITIRDFEERIKFEEELKKERTYFHSLFYHSPEAIVLMDEKHRVNDLNPAFIELFGYTLEDLKGKNVDDFILPPEEEREGKRITKSVMEGKIARTEGYRKRKDGKLIYVSVMGAPIFVDGEQMGIFGIYRDMTERKKAEEEREFYNSLLRHDISNKITVILGNLEILLESKLNKEQKNLVLSALNAAKSGSELISKIRRLNKIGKEELYYMELDDVLSRIVKNMKKEAENRGIKLHYEGIKGVIKADSLIDSVFSNIIQNAITHSECKNIRIYGGEVELNNKKYYKICIENDGKEIEKDTIKKIFNPGVKGSSSRGSGLGLYIVKTLVESYGGKIKLRSSPEKTVFEIYLPKV